MRVLITGGNGQLGTALANALNSHITKGVDLPDFDICNPAIVESEIVAFEPDVIINCAAYTNVDGCAKDPALAFRANGLGPKILATACAKYDIELVQISSNEVFPGENPDGYYEWDVIRPINPYGNSKAAGEFNVRTLHPKHYIVRIAWLFAPGGKNFIHAILRFARERGALTVVTDEVANPTYANDLAVAIGQLIETHQYGTYHLTNSGACSRYDFANVILEAAGLSNVTNTPIHGSEFKRASTPPPYCALHNTMAAGLGIEMRPWQDAVTEFAQNLGD